MGSALAAGLRGRPAGAHRQCARTSSCSSTSTARSWTRCTRRRAGGLAADEAGWALQQALLEHLEAIWQQAGRGHLGSARRPRHFTYSKVMAWVAFDRADQERRAVRLARPGRALARRCATRSTTRSAATASTPSSAPSSRPTARTRSMPALLLMPLVGFLPPDDPRGARHGRGDRAPPDARRLRAALRHRQRPSTACRPARAPFSPAASGSPTT